MTDHNEKPRKSAHELIPTGKCSDCGEIKYIMPLSGGRCLSCRNRWATE